MASTGADDARDALQVRVRPGESQSSAEGRHGHAKDDELAQGGEGAQGNSVDSVHPVTAQEHAPLP